MKEKDMKEEKIQKHEENELFENITLLMEDSKNFKDEEPKQAEKLMQNALKLARKGYESNPARFEFELLDIYCRLGDYHRHCKGGNINAGMKYYTKAVALCENLEAVKDKELASDCYSLAADLIFGFANVLFVSKRYTEAIQLFAKSLAFQKKMLKYDKLNYQKNIAKTLFKIGYSYWHTGQERDTKAAEQALLAHIEANEYIYRKEKTEEYLELYAMSHHNTGVFYKEYQRWIDAKRSFEQAYQLFTELQKTDESAGTVLELEEKFLKEIEENIAI